MFHFQFKTKLIDTDVGAGHAARADAIAGMARSYDNFVLNESWNKTTRAKPKSDTFKAIHRAAQGLHRAGAMTKTTLREYDALCLDVIPEFNAKDIKRIREVVLALCGCIEPWLSEVLL